MKKKNEKKEQLKILIVDDNELIRDSLQVLLQSLKDFKMHVQKADSGETAVEMVKDNVFDIILIDYSMPGISGSQAIKLIKRTKPEITIVGVSSYGELAIAEDMINAGANGYLIKDFETAELVMAIKTVREGKIYLSPEIVEKMSYNN